MPICIAVEASYVMSLYYEAESRNSQACNFAGNGTVNSNAPSGSSASAAASSCISNPSAVFTPTSASSTTGKSSSSTSHSTKSAAVAHLQVPLAFFGLTMTVIITLLGGLWTLA